MASRVQLTPGRLSPPPLSCPPFQPHAACTVISTERRGSGSMLRASLWSTGYAAYRGSITCPPSQGGKPRPWTGTNGIERGHHTTYLRGPLHAEDLRQGPRSLLAFYRFQKTHLICWYMFSPAVGTKTVNTNALSTRTTRITALDYHRVFRTISPSHHALVDGKCREPVGPKHDHHTHPGRYP